MKDEIKQRLAEATPGPWKMSSYRVGIIEKYAILSPHKDLPMGRFNSYHKEDAIFIANAPTDIAYLLSKVKQLEGVVEAAVESMDVATEKLDIALSNLDKSTESKSSQDETLKAGE